MERKFIPQKVTVLKEIFIANDGREFSSKVACENYENYADRREYMQRAETLKKDISASPVSPFFYEKYLDYKWYLISSEEELVILSKAYPDASIHLNEMCDKKNPIYIGLETDTRTGQYQFVTLEKLMERSRNFWGKFNIDVKFLK